MQYCQLTLTTDYSYANIHSQTRRKEFLYFSVVVDKDVCQITATYSNDDVESTRTKIIFILEKFTLTKNNISLTPLI